MEILSLCFGTWKKDIWFQGSKKRPGSSERRTNRLLQSSPGPWEIRDIHASPLLHQPLSPGGRKGSLSRLRVDPSTLSLEETRPPFSSIRLPHPPPNSEGGGNCDETGPGTDGVYSITHILPNCCCCYCCCHLRDIFTQPDNTNCNCKYGEGWGPRQSCD